MSWGGREGQDCECVSDAKAVVAAPHTLSTWLVATQTAGGKAQSAACSCTSMLGKTSLHTNARRESMIQAPLTCSCPEVVRAVGHRLACLLLCLDRHPQYAAGPQQPSGLGGRQVPLAQVHAHVRANCQRHVHAVVYYQGHASGAAHLHRFAWQTRQARARCNENASAHMLFFFPVHP